MAYRGDRGILLLFVSFRFFFFYSKSMKILFVPNLRGGSNNLFTHASLIKTIFVIYIFKEEGGGYADLATI